ncbi:hypothetical protein [Shewanella fodinae]|uniref:hypothetical protein n=1 Tax=Shewanella fodinae TaxID=552357 RepID=UPI00167312E5|nr:hypothetical protein [Shewanella fodinae]MCL2905183.1 hypothetical protein [Shewanella fodinae]GGY87945.1 hypothetical protein GCM10007169_01410 [Shewanella fodinae]
MSELQKALIQGMEPAEKIDILIGLTDITSEDNKIALHRHYVNGWPITTAAESRSLDDANFRKTVKSLEAVAVKLERYKEIEWARWGYKSPCATGE